VLFLIKISGSSLFIERRASRRRSRHAQIHSQVGAYEYEDWKVMHHLDE
jgi:hypothetical protein